MWKILIIDFVLGALLGIGVGGTHEVSAQGHLDNLKNRSEWGIQVGGQYAHVYLNDYYRFLLFESAPIGGYRYGALWRYRMGPYAGFQVEVGFSEKGYRQQYLRSNGFYEARFRYQQAAWLTHLYHSFHTLSLFLNAGFYAENLWHVRTRSWGEPRHEGEEFYPFIPERDPKYTMGIRGEGGFLWKSPIGKFQIAGGMSFSLMDFLKSDRLKQRSPPFESRHYVYYGTLGYLIPLAGLKK
ncbi:MAG: hypothetical protein OXB93_05320 [Cytophagales bacterium]|nr:hypothetical protein [Cytophagales bacterium]